MSTFWKSIISEAVYDIEMENTVNCLVNEVTQEMATDVSSFEMKTYKSRIKYESDLMDKEIISGMLPAVRCSVPPV